MPRLQHWAAAALCLLAAAAPGATTQQNGTVVTITLSAEEAQMSAEGLCDDYPPGYDENPPPPLPQRATADDLKWQPALDFDTDSCYNVPAIGPDGHIDAGRSRHEHNIDGCRDESDLDNGNVYVRNRCNNGWCAYVYDYFFEKDVGDRICIGHKYDWEHLVVWVKDGVPMAGAASAHGKYSIRKWEDIPKEGTHMKAVYNKDGAIGTHYFRFSKGAGDEPPENHKGVWWRSALVSWNGFPSTALRDKLVAYDFGSANFALSDTALPKNLKSASEKFPVAGFVFDVNRDDGSPGTP